MEVAGTDIGETLSISVGNPYASTLYARKCIKIEKKCRSENEPIDYAW